MTARPEATLQREVLRAVSRDPRVLVGVNVVGTFYRPTAIQALIQALRPFGDVACAVAVDALSRQRVAVGVGGVGAPDLLGACDGVAFAWELKSERGVVSDEQRRWHAAARGRGLAVEIVRSVGEAEAAIARMRGGR